MDFNLDDPLAGILSDGSDDSFFDDDILGKKKPVQKKESLTSKKTALFDLDDNITKPTPKTPEKSDVTNFNTKDTNNAIDGGNIKNLSTLTTPTPIKKSLIKDTIDFSDGANKPMDNDYIKSPMKSRFTGSVAEKLENIDEDMGKDKKMTKPSLQKGKSSQSLLDDILGGNIQPPSTSIKKKTDFGKLPSLGKAESKVSLPLNNPRDDIVKSDKVVKLNENEKGVMKSTKEISATSKKTDDWLGIFQSNDKEDDLTKNSNEMPDWLSAGNKKKQQKEDKKPESQPKKEEKKSEESAPNIKMHEQIPLDDFIRPPTMPSLTSNDNDITAESFYLQNQESQLMVALQLKAQEEKLAAMQMRQEESTRLQREAARTHQSQVEAMLQRQAENRQQMQAVIAAHQDRISQRIKALLGPPTTDKIDTDYDGEIRTERYESPFYKEKKQLLQLVQSLQENHDKEIDVMESSYRRQLGFLEVALIQSEDRMKDESDKLVKFYSEKISWLEEQHQMNKKITEENWTTFSERQKTENQLLMQQHYENIKILQEHHASLVENIRNAVKHEQNLIKDSTEFSSDLTELVAQVRESKAHCQEMLEKVDAITTNTQRDNEKSMATRETQITEMIQHLKRERESFEAEKAENRDMIRLLENRLKQMTSLMEEESAAFKQKKMEFEFEKATFNKQTEFAKTLLKKQDEEIKMTRDEIEKEYKEKISRIEDEKAKVLKESTLIAKDKIAVQNLKQDLEKMKTELQCQLDEVNEEKSKISIEKQRMHLEEQKIAAKSRDLDLLAKSAVDQQTQAETKFSEAEMIQRKYEERIRRIQEHVVSLNTREKQIAKEKVALSRERLSLHNERKEFESRQQCSLCKSTQHFNNLPNYEPTNNYPDSFVMPVSKDYNRSASTAFNAIEAEMAQLLGRNLGLKYATGANNNALGEEEHKISYSEQFGSQHYETSRHLKDYMDPKLMMLRLDVQQVISNLDHAKTGVVKDNARDEPNHENEK